MNREFAGAAVIGKLTAELVGTDLGRVLVVSSVSGWDFTPGGIFSVAINRGLPIEEKALCTFGSRNADGTGTLSVYVDPVSNHVYRGWDDTSLQHHPIGSKVEHIWTAIDAREAMSAFYALRDHPAHSHDGKWRSLLPNP